MGYLRGDGYLNDSAYKDYSYTLPVQVTETEHVEPIVVTVGQTSISTETNPVLAPVGPPVLVGATMQSSGAGIFALAAGLFLLGRKSKKRRR
jgi:hypothetical protein